MDKGYIQIYTGNGKGKTTAALGLGLRAVGSGCKVIMVQFLKGSPTSELISTKLLGNQFEIIRLVAHEKFFWQLTEIEKTSLKQQLDIEIRRVFEILDKNLCDVLILDEIFGALTNEMVTMEQLNQILDLKPEGLEIVLTGRNAPEEIIDRADLVTEMKPIKHYYEKGIKSRKGIEY
ncbi:MAG: cob(I)yrinic acid a,c-diamide adenosyltransferase [Firmicutes bacterium HGW-Firmicutes-1]|nr:MAG: cob(I)yrinic acid a,c-diamide adenosyltransferase [Firmicutes bacterium HGW-Firmicutes-1]